MQVPALPGCHRVSIPHQQGEGASAARVRLVSSFVAMHDGTDREAHPAAALSLMHAARYDAFTPKKKIAQTNIHYEKAAILFNLAAVVSQIGLASDRTTSDGLKVACQMFQVGRRGRPSHVHQGGVDIKNCA